MEVGATVKERTVTLEVASETPAMTSAIGAEPAVQDIDELLAKVAKFHRRALAKMAEAHCQEIQLMKAEHTASQLAVALEEGSVQRIPGVIVQEEGKNMTVPRPLDIVPASPPVEDEPSPRLFSNSSSASARKDFKEQDHMPLPRRNSSSSSTSKNSCHPSARLVRRPTLRLDVPGDILASAASPQASALSALALTEAAATKPRLLPLWNHIKNMGDMSPLSPKKGRQCSKRRMSQSYDILAEQNKASVTRRLSSRIVAHPSSPKRIGYELIGLFLILFDMVWLPLQAFEPPASLLTAAQSWASILYWTFDIPCSFCVGFVVPSQGIVETSLPKIAKNYMRGWLAFDILVVFIDWALTVLSLSGEVEVFAGADYMRMGKSIRLLKLLRLLRMVKAQKALADLIEQIQSESAVIILGIVKQLFMIMFVNHFLACSWFAVGSLDPQRQDTWVKENELVGKSILYQYFTCLHWSLTQFTPASMEVFPRNDMERTFTVVVILLAMCVFSSFISTITNAVAQLRNINSDRNEQLSRLRRYFLENKVSVPLMACIWSCLHKSMATASKRRRVHEEDISQVLEILPVGLRLELAEQVHASTLAVHPFFKHYGACREPQTVRLCKEARAMSLNISAELFTVETPAQNMFFLVDGSMAYCRQDDNEEASENSTLVHGVCWAAEAVIWINWKHAGRLTASTHCELVRLHADTVHKIMVTGETNFQAISRYARAFVRYVRKHPDEASDLCDDSLLWSQLAKIAFEGFEAESIQPLPTDSSKNSKDHSFRISQDELLRQAARKRQIEDEYFCSSSASNSSDGSGSFSSDDDGAGE